MAIIVGRKIAIIDFKDSEDFAEAKKKGRYNMPRRNTGCIVTWSIL